MDQVRSTLESVAIRFAGDSGDGIQLTGDRFTQESARLGNILATLPDFPAEIRAPAGTISGVSAYQINFGSEGVFTPGDRVDALVAMNPAALKKNLSEVKPNGIIICNKDNFHEKNLKLAGYESNPLDDDTLSHKYTLLAVPISSLTQEALKESGMTKSAILRCSNFFALGVVCWLFSRGTDETLEWIDKKFAKNPEVAAANKAALRGGMAYAEASEAFPSPYQIPSAKLAPGTYRNVTGHQGVVYGLLAASELSGRQLFFGGYPITPASEIMQELSALPHFGVVTLQAEDEIAACCAAIGASYAGSLGATATSGPGFALKQEAMGLAVITELPLIVVNVQRAGPSTGMPTKTEQADLLQALFGRNGEAPIPVLAISRPADAFDTTVEACRMALEYMTPVVILSEGYLGFGSEPWKIPDIAAIKPIKTRVLTETAPKPYQPYARDAETLARSWAIPGTPGFEHRIGGLEKLEVVGSISYDGPNHQKMVDTRAAKVAGIAKTYPETKIDGAETGDILVIGWGSTWGPIRAAVQEARQGGISVSHLHLRYLNPLPLDLGGKIAGFNRILVPEGNLGQFGMILQSRFRIAVEGFHKVQGQPFKISELVEKIRSMSLQ